MPRTSRRDKYRAVKVMTPAHCVKGFIQNLLGEKVPDEVVIDADLHQMPALRCEQACQAALL